MREGSGGSQAPTEVISPPVEVVADVELDVDRDTCLGVGSRMSGRLSFEGNVLVAGLVEGELQATGTLVIEASGEIKAKIDAAVVIVRGHVLADVTAREKLEIGATGSVHGAVSTPALVIREGGVLEGRCAMSAKTKRAAEAA